MISTTTVSPIQREPELPPDEARRLLTVRLMLPIDVARATAGKVRQLGSLVFMGGAGERHAGRGLGIIGPVSVATPVLIANLALELAPIRVNLVAAGFVDTSLSASLLGDGLAPAASSSGRRSPSGVSYARRTLPPWPSTP